MLNIINKLSAVQWNFQNHNSRLDIPSDNIYIVDVKKKKEIRLTYDCMFYPKISSK